MVLIIVIGNEVVVLIQRNEFLFEFLDITSIL